MSNTSHFIFTSWIAVSDIESVDSISEGCIAGDMLSVGVSSVGVSVFESVDSKSTDCVDGSISSVGVSINESVRTNAINARDAQTKARHRRLSGGSGFRIEMTLYKSTRIRAMLIKGKGVTASFIEFSLALSDEFPQLSFPGRGRRQAADNVAHRAINAASDAAVSRVACPKGNCVKTTR